MDFLWYASDILLVYERMYRTTQYKFMTPMALLKSHM